MLGNSSYYFGTIKKLITVFGYIFNDITIVREDSNIIKVPIELSTKEKYDLRLEEDPNAGDPTNQRHVDIILPRMGYSLKSIIYDPSRKISTTRYLGAKTQTAGLANKQLVSVPMIFTFELVIQTRTLEDGWMIIEQFLPFFTPDYVVTIKNINEMNIVTDIPFTIISSEQKDTYNGNFLEKRVIEWTYTFEAKAALYPPIKPTKVIIDANVNVGSIFNMNDIDSSVGFTAEITPKTALLDSPVQINIIDK